MSDDSTNEAERFEDAAADLDAALAALELATGRHTAGTTLRYLTPVKAGAGILFSASVVSFSTSRSTRYLGKSSPS